MLPSTCDTSAMHSRELLLPCPEPSSAAGGVEILAREEGRCGRPREDHIAMEGMEIKSYVNPCLVLHNF